MLPPSGPPCNLFCPQRTEGLSILKSDPVGPWLTVYHGNYNNALPGPAGATHELALAHLSDLISYHFFLPSALKSSILQPIPGPLHLLFCTPFPTSLFFGLSSDVTLFVYPTKVAPTPATGCQIPLLEYLASLSGEPAPTST